MNYLTYSYLLTPLHTGASAQAGNMMGIARESFNELPYLPSSSLRGKIRSVLEAKYPDEAGKFLGEKIKDEKQPTEGEVWLADATLLLFPVASFSHHYLWITCPLWLSRWNRWLKNDQLETLIQQWRTLLNNNTKKAIASVPGKQIYLQGAILSNNESNQEIETIPDHAACWDCFKEIPDGNGVLELKDKLVVLSNQDCASLVETGLQREVRIALKDNEKTASDGSFRSEEAIPSETVLFFPWGLKPNKDQKRTENVRKYLDQILNDRLQFGGLEGLGRGWTENKTVKVNSGEVNSTEENA
ncbi:MAG: type III-B CRISPR module RAMP protein Cmr4 [Symploca sp. SIO2E9]|nr:type III-B CRISPR module RAMP protein Cmr4 [Symploca sp. SIO2E9]